ncbi:MAG: FAD-dependent oxidoreductase, partial [Alphaproteobacteria bacterium]
CTAWALARAGWQVRVVEQAPIPNPRGASVDQHRLIRHAYGAQAGYMRMVDPAYAAWEMIWAALGTRHYVETGVLALANHLGGWLAESRVVLREDGHACADLPPDQITARFPMLSDTGIAAAFTLPRGGVLLAERIIAGLAAHLVTKGVVFETAEVAAPLPARKTLRLANGTERSADLLVLAAGPWGPRLFGTGLDGRVVPSRQILVRLEPPSGFRAAWEAAPMLLDLAEDGGFYAVPPVAGTALKIGDHRFSRQGDAGADPRAASPAEIEEILALARPRLINAAGYRVLGAQACYYDVEDREEFILEAPTPGCFVMSGFSGHGFKFAPVLGLALAAAAEDNGLARALPGWAAGRDAPVPGLLAGLESTR